MKATMIANLQSLGIKRLIAESYEGRNIECEAWVALKVEEMIDYLGKNHIVESKVGLRRISFMTNPGSWGPESTVEFTYE